ncbi:MAG: ester cyclase [Candidatus Sericytochromatia bacterium]
MIGSLESLAGREWHGELHRAVVRRFMEAAINRGNAAVAAGLLAESFVDHGGFLGERIEPGRFEDFAGRLRQAFPDGAYAIEDVIADSDKVVLRVTFTGTHGGAFRGSGPTLRRVRVTGVHIFRCEGARILEHWAMESHRDLDARLATPTPAAACQAAIW